MIALAAASCGPKVKLVPEKNFDKELDGKKVALYTIKGGDLIAQVTNFGGRVVSLWVPNKDGGMTDVVLGHNTLEEYAEPDGERFVGCCVGPVANRICKGRFCIDGQEYNVPINNDENSLHGGFKGVDMLVWDVEEVDDNSITLKVVHPDGMEGYPGNITIEMTYTLTCNNALKIDYEAVSDKKTPINLSHHAMINIGGELEENIEDQIMRINADFYTPTDPTMIPTGEIKSVEGTPFDFRQPKLIGRDIALDDPDLAIGRGFDHNWCVNAPAEGELRDVCTVHSHRTGIIMQVLSDQPGVQFYSGNFFDGRGVGKNGKSYDFRHALAIETQNYPDAVNHENFPCSVYEPGQEYSQVCIYKFSVCPKHAKKACGKDKACCKEEGCCGEAGCCEKDGCCGKDDCCDK